MSVTAFASGTQTPIVGTEHILASVNVPGTFTLHLDANLMAAGDVYEIRVYQTILTGGAVRVCFFAQFHGAQPVDDQIKVSIPISNELTDSVSLKFTLKQTFGAAHNIPWKVLKHA